MKLPDLRKRILCSTNLIGYFFLRILNRSKVIVVEM